MTYLITGTDYYGKRFRKETVNLSYALGHNVYNGNLWEVDENGKRTRVHAWSN